MRHLAWPIIPSLALALCIGTTVPGQLTSGAVVPGAVAAGFPTGFVENAGQWPADVAHVACYGDVFLRAESGGIAIQHEVIAADGGRRGSLVRFGLFGQDPTRPTSLGDPLPGVLNFLLGSDPRAHRTGVRRFAGVDYGALAPGITACLLAGQSSPSLRISVAPGADVSAIRIDVAGATPEAPCGAGTYAVLLATSLGHLTLRAVDRGSGIPLRLAIDDHREIRIAGPSSNVAEDLVIDLQLEWSTYIGGSAGEYAGPIALDAQERVVFAGWTYSLDFPTTPGAYDSTFNGGAGSLLTDAFVSCLESNGSGLVFSTYLGGAGNESVQAIEIEASGNIIVAGPTASPDFPTTPRAWDTQLDSFDAFVTRLGADGSTIIASTFLGGSKTEKSIEGMAVLQTGSIAVACTTSSTDYPVTPNAFDTMVSQVEDGALTVFVEDLSRPEYSTLFGGPWGDQVHGAVVRPDGSIAITGVTLGPAGFPVTPGALDTVAPALGAGKGYVIVIDPVTGAIVYGTFVPGSPWDIAAHPDGSVTVVGDTTVAGLATPEAFDTTYSGSGDGFLFRLSADGSSLHYATYLGDINIDNAFSVALDSAGRPTIVGQSYSIYPVTPGAFFTPKTTSNLDIIVSQLEADGSRLIFSTHIGGPDAPGWNDSGYDLTLTPMGAVVVTGASDGGFPVTPGSWDPDEPATFDSVVFKLTMLPTGAEAYGAATPASPGAPPPYIGVDAWPSQSDSSAFAITCLSAPPGNTQGLLLASLGGLQAPLPFKGGGLWLDPAGLFLFIPVASDELGYSRLPVAIPSAPPLDGVVTHWQYLWKPEGGGVPWPMSNALELTIQP